MKVRNPDNPLLAEDSALFRRTVGDVRPLNRGQAIARHRPLPPARPQSREADEAAVIAALLDDFPEHWETGEEQRFARAGVQHSVQRKLRRGQYRCQAELDLHGLFVSNAKVAVVRFLAESQSNGRRCVRIVYGKGLRSGQRGPVLPAKVTGWLRQRNEVLAFCSARRVDGGTGALYVLLRRPD
ncbi:MAG: Smr/MutS family protein [Salinisphaera sp.]|nr:Smr/MutS family protein [Salinisphaera sp.]